MEWRRGIIGAVLLVVGIVWIGQGVGLIHGSFMTGEGIWAFFGVIAALIGLGLLRMAVRVRSGRPPEAQ
jgi:hypothetical protein